MKKILILLLTICGLVGVGYCAYQVYDTFATTHVAVNEKPLVGPWEQ